MNWLDQGYVDSIEYQFNDIGLLKIALTHPSYTNENRTKYSYERLELLGNSVVNMIVADMLYHRFPDHDEGKLAIMLSNLINTSALASIAKSIDLDRQIIFGESEENGIYNQRNLENAMKRLSLHCI